MAYYPQKIFLGIYLVWIVEAYRLIRMFGCKYPIKIYKTRQKKHELMIYAGV